MSRQPRRTGRGPLASPGHNRARRAVAMGGMLAAVGGLVTLRATLATPPTQALAAAGMAAPLSSVAATVPAGPPTPSPRARHTHRPKPAHHARKTHPATPTPTQTPQAPATTSVATTTQAAPAPTHSAAPHTATPRPKPSPTPPPPPPPTKREITGNAYDVGYGIVQVRVTLVGSKMTDVTALQLPEGGRSTDISNYAAPKLRQEALAAQSANIDTVSGASYTSAGYAASLQSALDAARRS